MVKSFTDVVVVVIVVIIIIIIIFLYSSSPLTTFLSSLGYLSKSN